MWLAACTWNLTIPAELLSMINSRSTVEMMEMGFPEALVTRSEERQIFFINTNTFPSQS